MDEKTRKALEGSIKKWEKIVDGTGEDRGGDNCPLCQLFAVPSRIGGCEMCHGCPVMEKTGQPACHGTPYREFADLPRRNDYVRKKAAQKELDFLKSLLPVEEEVMTFKPMKFGQSCYPSGRTIEVASNCKEHVEWAVMALKECAKLEAMCIAKPVIERNKDGSLTVTTGDITVTVKKSK